MKKIFIALAIALSVITVSSCSQDLLDIQQKGAVSMDDFYITDDDATAAIVAVYSQMNGFFYDYKFMTNLPSDDIYAGGGSRGDNDQWSAINEFRINPSQLPSGYYRTPYAIIYRCNLIISKFENPDTPVKTRVVAEARFFRAWAHMLLTIYFGNPPLIDYVMDGSEKPENTPASELWPWIIKEFNDAASVLPSKSNKNDKEGGAAKLVEAANAADNESLSPVFLRQAAFVYEDLKNTDKALELYKQIKEKYPQSVLCQGDENGTMIDTYIERLSK